MNYQSLILFLLFSSLFIKCNCGSGSEKQTIAGVIEDLPQEQLDSISYKKILDFANTDNFDGLIKTTQTETAYPENLSLVLDYEREILKDWTTLPDYRKDSPQIPNKSNLTNTDSLVLLRCAAVDKAPIEVKRTPGKSIARMSNFFLFEFSRIDIPINLHIVNNDDGYMMYRKDKPEPKLKVKKEHINKQMSVLNNTFNPHKIHFTLNSTTYHSNSQWNQSGMTAYDSIITEKMLQSIAKTPETHLNVYVIKGATKGDIFLGEATFPWNPTAGKHNDYAIISCFTLPGFLSEYSKSAGQGKTLVHEIGHYLGLYHTFEGNSNVCDGTNNDGCYYGDQVDDTPPQKICHFGNCSEYDTCLGGEKDQIENFMGYNNDECMKKFTKGQITRIYKATDFLRSHYFITEEIFQ